MAAMSYGNAHPTPPRPPAEAEAASLDPARAIDAERLFGDRQVLVIAFRGEQYQLRRTRSGKLILTK